jgi:hypothetical protein
VYQSACARACERLTLACARPSALKDSTGSTQGIRLRIRPPSSAESSANHSERDTPAGGGVSTAPAAESPAARAGSSTSIRRVIGG